ncbi:MAG: hypothetical protein AAF489_17165 [Bacteroidota bacterium]
MKNKSIQDPELEALLSKRYEGKLFAHIWLHTYQGSTYWVNKDYYTVKEGKVCFIEKDGQLRHSDDTMLQLSTQCKLVGKYDPTKNYQRKHKEFTYAEIKKLFKI